MTYEKACHKRIVLWSWIGHKICIYFSSTRFSVMSDIRFVYTSQVPDWVFCITSLPWLTNIKLCLEAKGVSSYLHAWVWAHTPCRTLRTIRENIPKFGCVRVLVRSSLFLVDWWSRSCHCVPVCHWNKGLFTSVGFFSLQCVSRSSITVSHSGLKAYTNRCTWKFHRQQLTVTAATRFTAERAYVILAVSLTLRLQLPHAAQVWSLCATGLNP